MRNDHCLQLEIVVSWYAENGWDRSGPMATTGLHRQVRGKAVSRIFTAWLMPYRRYEGALTLSKAHGIFSFQPRATT